jgi:hypothetical protein
MTNDERGGATADNDLEQRLASHFTSELDRARHDYPALKGRVSGEATDSGRKRPRRVWPRLVAAPIGLAAVLLALVAVSPLLMSAPTSPATPGSGPTAASVATGLEGIPSQIDGGRVYRAADKAAFPQSGSFMLGGLVTTPDVIPPCAMRNMTAAEADLVPYCEWQAIDGIQVAPKGLDISNSKARLIVARVHMSDTEAMLCPVSIQADCKAAVVVEAVVWSGTVAVNQTPTPGLPEATNSASTVTVGPVATPVAPNSTSAAPANFPTTIGGQPVYRADNMPGTVAWFTLGGKLVRDTTCAAPSPDPVRPPSCGYWTLDGLRVGVQTPSPLDTLDGKWIVARVYRGRASVDCFKAPCLPVEFLYITEVDWVQP